MRALTYLVDTSVDGFIADRQGGLDHLAVSPELIAFLSTCRRSTHSWRRCTPSSRAAAVHSWTVISGPPGCG
jgi:hypothetical protein